MLGNIVVVAIVIAVLGIMAYYRLRPPVISAMSDDWQLHLRYQLMKDGVRQTITGRTDGSE